MEDVSTHIFIINFNLLFYQCASASEWVSIYIFFDNTSKGPSKKFIQSFAITVCKTNLSSWSSPKETKKRQFKALTQQRQGRNELTGHRLSPRQYQGRGIFSE